MKQNKLHIILKIFGFLLLSIGILYICQFFTKTFEEGFQTTPSTRQTNITQAGCTLETDADRDIILCPTEDAVKSIMQNIPINLPKDSDNVCLVTGDPSNKYYTCYTRPAPPVFNDLFGVYRDFDPILDDDNLAFDLVPSINTFCASYVTNTTKINRGIQSTQMVYNRVLLTEFSTMRYKTELLGMSNRYCFPIIQGMEFGCSNISTSYKYITDIFRIEGINDAKRVTLESLNILSNISTKTFAQYGSICKESSQYTLTNFVDKVEPTPLLQFDSSPSGTVS